jgi:hypothetical protein
MQPDQKKDREPSADPRARDREDEPVTGPDQKSGVEPIRDDKHEDEHRDPKA